VPTVTIEVHKLWSGAGASPHARDFGHLARRLQPLSSREFAVAEVLVNADLSLSELPDEKVLLAIAVDIGPTGGGVTRTLDSDRNAVAFEAHRRFEICGACGKPATDQQR
jgi:hypothetical protein